MDGKDLLEKMGQIDIELVQSAAVITPRKSIAPHIKYTSIAACAALVISVVVIVAVIIHNGTPQKPVYTENTLSVINGQYYLNFAGGNDVTEEDGRYECVDGSLEMESLSQLKRKILNSDFTEKEEIHIKRYFSENENGILMFNPHKIYEPQMKDAEITQISWLGDLYIVNLENNAENYNAVAFCYDDQQFVYNKLDNYLKFFTPEGYEGRDNINILFEAHDKITGKSTYYYTTTMDYEWKCIRYTIESETRKLYVEERYALRGGVLTEPSEIIPHSINVYCEKEDFLFEINIYPEQPILMDVVSSIDAICV